MAEYIVGLNSLNARLTAISGAGATKAMLDRLSARTLTAMKHRIPRKTSTTSRSLHVAMLTPTRSTIVGNQLANWLDEGTGLYGPRHQKIVPVNKKALHWTSGTFGRHGTVRLTGNRRSGKAGAGARDVFARSVKGMRPRPFIDASVKEGLARSGLTDVIVERWNGAA